MIADELLELRGEVLGRVHAPGLAARVGSLNTPRERLLIIGQPFLTLDSIVQGSHVILRELQANLIVTDRPSVPFHHVYDIRLEATPLGPIEATDELAATQELCGAVSVQPPPPSVAPCNAETMISEIVRPHHGDDFVLVLEGVPGATLRVFGPGFAEIGSGIRDVIVLTRSLVGGETIVVAQSLPGCIVQAGFSIVVAPP